MNELARIAALGVEVFVFPLAATMWFNTRTLSGASSAAALSYFWYLVRIGFDIYNPLSPIDADHATAVKFYFGWYPLLIAVAVVVGWFICLVMDIREPVGLYTLFPSFRTHDLENVGAGTPCDPIDKAKLRDYLCACDSKGIERWCFTHIQPNYWNVLVGVLLVLWTLFLPHLLFWGLLTVNKWAALFSALPVAAIGYFLFWVYSSYRTDLRNWGATEYNMKERLEAIKKDPVNSIYAEDPDISDFAPALYAETQSLINKNVLIMSLTHLLGFILIGGLIVFPTVPNISVVWPVGLAYILLLAFIIAVVAYVGFSKMGKEATCPRYCPKTGKLLNSRALKSAATPFKAKQRTNMLDRL